MAYTQGYLDVILVAVATIGLVVALYVNDKNWKNWF